MARRPGAVGLPRRLRDRLHRSAPLPAELPSRRLRHRDTPLFPSWRRALSARRLRRLLTGLVTMGAGIGLMADAELGLAPWDVLHQGLASHTGLTLGLLNILVGAAVLSLWIPLRQRPGLGTVLNVVIIGLVVDATLALLPHMEALPPRVVAMVGGVVLMGVGSGLYIGAGLGAGPRDGLMTGVAARGHTVRSVRTALEVTVLVLGWLLGGTVGVGTVVLALAIGPLVHLSLERLGLPALEPPALEPAAR